MDVPLECLDGLRRPLALRVCHYGSKKHLMGWRKKCGALFQVTQKCIKLSRLRRNFSRSGVWDVGPKPCPRGMFVCLSVGGAMLFEPLVRETPG